MLESKPFIDEKGNQIINRFRVPSGKGYTSDILANFEIIKRDKSVIEQTLGNAHLSVDLQLLQQDTSSTGNKLNPSMFGADRKINRGGGNGWTNNRGVWN